MLVEAIGGMEVVEVVPKNFSTRHQENQRWIFRIYSSYAWGLILFLKCKKYYDSENLYALYGRSASAVCM